MAAVVAAAAVSLGAPAGAAPSDYVGTTTTVCAPPCAEVLGSDLGTGVGNGAVAGRGRAAVGLPVTGGDVVGLTLVGAGLLAVGSVLVRGSRRRTA